MNELSQVEETTEKTITSLELAKLTGRRHADILRSIESMNEDLETLGKTQPAFSSYSSQQGKRLPMYTLTIYQCELLALALDGIARIKVLDKIEELREKQNKPMTFEEMAKQTIMLADKKIKALETRVEEDKPKVEFADTVASSSDLLLAREYAKVLYDEEGIKIGQNKLLEWFRDNGYLNRNNEPYQSSMKWFRVVESTTTSIFGTRINKTTKITGAGQLYFLSKLKEE